MAGGICNQITWGVRPKEKSFSEKWCTVCLHFTIRLKCPKNVWSDMVRYCELLCDALLHPGSPIQLFFGCCKDDQNDVGSYSLIQSQTQQNITQTQYMYPQFTTKSRKPWHGTNTYEMLFLCNSLLAKNACWYSQQTTPTIASSNTQDAVHFHVLWWLNHSGP